MKVETLNPKTRKQKLQDLEIAKLQLEIILLKAKIGDLTPEKALSLMREIGKGVA